MQNLNNDLSNIKNILVIKFKYHGDVLLTSPIFSVLKNKFPDANIDAVIYDETLPMLELHPAIRQIFAIKKRFNYLNLKDYFQDQVNFIKDIYKNKYDILIHLDESMRGAWLNIILQPKISVALFKGKNKYLWNKIFTNYYRYTGPNKRHTVEIHLDALRVLGIFPEEKHKQTIFVTNSETQENICKILDNYKIDKLNYIVLHPTSRFFYKCLTVEQNVDLIYKILEQYKLPILITSAPDLKEKQYISEILKKLEVDCLKQVIDLSGKLSLKQLGELIRHAKLFVGADSMPMHLASAVQTPTIVFFGPSFDHEWSPWQVKHQIIKTQSKCVTCASEGCGNNGLISECLTTLDINSLKLMDI